MHTCGAATAKLQHGGNRGEICQVKGDINLQILAKDGKYYAINYCPLLGTGSICIEFLACRLSEGVGGG